MNRKEERLLFASIDVYKRKIRKLEDKESTQEGILEIKSKINDAFSLLLNDNTDTIISEIIPEHINRDEIAKLVLKDLETFDYRLGMPFVDYVRPRIIQRLEAK